MLTPEKLAQLQEAARKALLSSVQWEQARQSAEALEPILDHLIYIGAQAKVFYHDGTTMRVKDLRERIQQEDGGRTGIFTSGIVCEGGEESDPAVFHRAQACARKGSHTPRSPISDPGDPYGWHAMTESFLEWMAIQNYSPKTVENRPSELAHPRVGDLDYERGIVVVPQGKGRKDRMFPIGGRALGWIRRYLDEVRPGLVREPDDGTLFLTNLFEPFTPNRLTQLVREYIDAADLGKRGSCHLLRHTCATLMLEGGADTRFIQQLLGHAELSTTQNYTQVSIQQFNQVHSACHAAKLERPAAVQPSRSRRNGPQSP